MGKWTGVWMVAAAAVAGGVAWGQVQVGPYGVRAAGGGSPAATLPAGTQVAGTQAASRPAMEAAQLQAIVTALGSESFAERERAQKELGKAGMKDREALKALAEAATDAEVKARLLNRYEQIEEDAALNPPPISIDVKDASLAEVAAALNKAMGERMSAAGAGFTTVDNGPGGSTYTLKAVDEPFWDVFMKLSKQGEIQVQPYQGLQLIRSNTGIRRGVVSGPFCVYAQSLSYQRTVDLQKDVGEELQPASLMLSYGVAIDPRVQLIAYTTPVLSSVMDDAGNELLKAGFTAGGNRVSSLRRQWSFPTSIPLEIVPGGKKIVSAKGVMRGTVMVSQQEIEVADLEKQGNTPIEIRGRKVTFTKFELKDGRVAMSAASDPGVRGADGQVERTGMTLVDAKGRTVYTGSLQGGFSGTFGGQFTGPIKAVLTVPTKVKEVEVPFELKDLPLPVQ